jgi:hypothetical protein
VAFSFRTILVLYNRAQFRRKVSGRSVYTLSAVGKTSMMWEKNDPLFHTQNNTRVVRKETSPQMSLPIGSNLS